MKTALFAAQAPTGADSRERRFSAAGKTEALAWQAESRRLLFDLMKLSDLVAAEKLGQTDAAAMEFKVEQVARTQEDGFIRYDLTINSTPARRIAIVLTIPQGQGPFPAVVCIHGHGGNRDVVYDSNGIYRGFAREVARSGYVTISTDVGQHKVYETERTLMGERLWDLIRCVSYLTTRPEVDAKRIGCAGLSLGGEMAMWLGAMDIRVKAVVSSGYLTTIANMRQGHCPCWEFDGLARNFDWADIYSLTAPRALQCQIGQKETAPGGFPAEIARSAMTEVLACYRIFEKPENALLVIHPEGHVFDLQPGLAFLDRFLLEAGSK